MIKEISKENSDILASFATIRLHGVIDGATCTCSAGSSCRSIGKHPRSSKGVYDALKNRPSNVWMNGNAGIVCGHDDLVVVDIDPRNGGDVWLKDYMEQHNLTLPETVTVETGGGGTHLYFRGKVRSTKLPGVDIQSHGKYVVAPPSVHASGEEYKWKPFRSPVDLEIASLPDWLIELCIAQEPVRSWYYDEESGSELTKEDVIDALSHVSPDCCYSDWIEVGMALKDGGYSLSTWDTWSSKSGKYPGPDVLRKKWDTFNGSGMTVGTIIFRAKDAGWQRKTDEAPSLGELIDLKLIQGGQTKKDAPSEERASADESQVSEQQNISLTDIEVPKGLLHDLVDFVKKNAVSEHPTFAIASALSCISAVAQSRYLSPTGCSLSLYNFLVAPPASGKESYKEIPEEYVKKINSNLCCPNLQSPQALRTCMANYSNSLTFFSGELGQYFLSIADKRQQSKADLLEDILNLWSQKGKPLQKLQTKNDNESSPEIDNASFSILGCTTRRTLERLVSKQLFNESGLFSRCDFYFSEVPQSDDANFNSLILDDEIVRKLRSVFMNDPKTSDGFKFDATNPKQQITTGQVLFHSRVQWSDDTVFERWDTERKRYLQIVREMTECLSQSVYQRAAEKIVRIASLTAIASKPQSKPYIITHEHLTFAIEWVAATIPAMVAFADQYSASTTMESVTDAIERCLGRAGAITVGTLRNNSRVVKAIGKRELTDILDALELAGVITQVRQGKTILLSRGQNFTMGRKSVN